MNNHAPESVLDLIQHTHYNASYADYGGVTAIKKCFRNMFKQFRNFSEK